MTAFVDTSVVLRFVLEGDISLHQAFAATVTACSDVAWIESMRVAQRHAGARALGFMTPLADEGERERDRGHARRA